MTSDPLPVPSSPAPGAPVVPAASRILALTLVGAVVAGLVAAVLGTLIPAIPAGTHTIQVQGGPMQQSSKEDLDVAEANNGAVQYGLLGGLLGLALGTSGLIAGAGSTSRLRKIAPILGLVDGVLLVAAFSLFLLPRILARIFPSAEDLPAAIGVHAGLLALVGLAAGLAFAVGLGGDRAVGIRAILGGLIGAVVGAVAFDLLAGVLFSVEATTDPVPKSVGSRFLMHGVGALAIGLGTALAVLDARRGPKKSKATTPADLA